MAIIVIEIIANNKMCYFPFIFQSVIMLMFREEKSPEDEIKAWQFWHSRQHSVKQRILDAGNVINSEKKTIHRDKLWPMVVERMNGTHIKNKKKLFKIQHKI